MIRPARWFVLLGFLLACPAAGEMRVLVAGGNAPNGGWVGAVRLADNSVVGVSPLPGPMDGAHSVKVHPDGRKAYVTGHNGVAVVDPGLLTVRRVIPMAEEHGYGLAFVPSGAYALVGTSAGVVRRIDAATDTVLPGAIAVHAGSALDVVVNQAGTRAYVVCNGAGTIDVVDLTLASPAVTASVDLSSTNLQVAALGPGESELFVTDAGNNRLRVVRASDLVEVTPGSYPSSPTLWYPRSLSITADGGTAFVGNRFGPPNEDSILVVRLADGLVAARIHDPDTNPDPSVNTGTANPRTSRLSPDGSTLYVALHGTSTIAAVGTSGYARTYMTLGPAPIGLDIADAEVAQPIPATTGSGLLVLLAVLAASGGVALSLRRA